MSIHSLPNHSQLSLTIIPAHDMTSHETPEFRLTRNDLDALGFVISPPMHRRHVLLEKHSIPEGGPHRDAHLHPSHASEILFHSHSTTPSMPSCLDQKIQHGLASWWPRDMQMAPASSYISSWPTTMNGTHSDDTSSGSHPIHNLGRHGTYFGSGAVPNSRQAPWPDLPDGRPPLPLTESLGYYLHDAPSARQSFSPVSHAAYSQHTSPSNNPQVIEPSIRPNVPSQQLPNLPFSRSFPHPCPPPDQHVRIVHEVYSPSLSRNRGARAIEYDGLWLDEGELRKALIEVDGKLTVLQCLWEQHHTPCHLWIKGDKSSINAHIQKWHGGKPGGEKLEVDCCWSSCGKKMRKESITRHILGVHLGQLWECRGCGKENTRNDAHRRHTADSDSEACRALSALITYSADTQVIDVRAALTSGGRL